MREAYGPFLEALRTARPQTPIVLVTPLYTSREERMPSLKADWAGRREHIATLARQRISAGDTHLFLVDGSKLLEPAMGDGLVDGSHPNDLGFHCMAEGLAPCLRRALRLP